MGFRIRTDATRNINWSIMDQLIFFATCRTCSGVYRCGCVWSHALPNPDGKDHRPRLHGSARALSARTGPTCRTRAGPEPIRKDGTPQQKERRKERRPKTRKKDTRKKNKDKKKRSQHQHKKHNKSKNTATTPPKPKLKTQEKYDARLAPGCAETAVNGGFPTKLSIVRGV